MVIVENIFYVVAVEHERIEPHDLFLILNIIYLTNIYQKINCIQKINHIPHDKII